MALVNRQQSLFAAEDWKVAYRAYSEVNFQAYDFDTIRTALVEYVRSNFPENFNDYLESSEFIAIIELLAYLSQSLAFRMDLNSRENFLETAERRDSVFKLARMLGYNPKRNIAASGLMKITAVRTTEPLVDSLGTDLSNRQIYWNDANNPQSYEQFIVVLNAAMAGTNRFASPYKSSLIGGIQTELYQIATPITAPIAYNFSLPVSGAQLPFNVVNPDFVDGSFFYEQHPDPTNQFNLIYRNDQLGLASANTGFFVMFKQGKLESKDLDFTIPLQSRTEDIFAENINETDVYVQQINTAGAVVDKWLKIPNTAGQTLNYNVLNFATRNLYAIENVDNSGIRLRFPDGNFGNVPNGIFRVWYRQSEPARFTIQPEEARNVTVSIPYVNRRNQAHALTVTFSLQEAVNNSLPPESLTAIKQRAPQVYYTQNRMVSAQDYNILPIAVSSNITKMKALNRTHAGHSRYIDINDPTGTFQNIDTFAKDGILFVENAPTTDVITINDNITPAEVTAGVLPLMLKNQSLNNFVYRGMRNSWIQFNGGKFVTNNLNIRWNPLPLEAKSPTGFMTETFSGGGERNVMVNTDTRTAVFKENNFVKFVNSNDLSDYKWVRIVSVTNNGALTSGLSTGTGPWTLSDEVALDWYASEVIVSLRKLFTAAESATIQAQLTARKSFGLGYDVSLDEWYVIDTQNLNKGDFSVASAKSTSATGADSSWLILFEYSPINNNSYRYNVTIRGEDYVVQSASELKFYNIKNVKVVDPTTKSSQDRITFTTLNTAPGSEETFEWYARNSSAFGWRNTTTGSFHVPTSFATNIPLRTRDTKWYDIDIAWKSNFGLFNPSNGTGSLADIVDPATGNRYVSEAVVNLNTYFDDGTETAVTSNVTVANNTGQINRIPSDIVIPFNNTTFGVNILDAAGNITYRQYNSDGTGLEIFHGNTTVYSYGTDGTTLNTSEIGRLSLADANVTAQTGNLIYSDLEDNVYHLSRDRFNLFRDQLVVNYKNNKEKLAQPVVWEVTDVYKYDDGYTDPRKVIVAPLDTDNDLVPDRPLQFSEYVDANSIELYEYYTDFDGYSYDKPVQGVILDYRKENALVVNFTNNTVSPASYNAPTTLSSVDWILVKNLAIAEQSLNNELGRAGGIKVYAAQENKVYLMTVDSTYPLSVTAVETQDFFVRNGRGPTQNTQAQTQEDSIIRWQHVAPNDVRIDPSISNVVEMIVLTTSYFGEVSSWVNNGAITSFPREPTSAELSNEFAILNQYKSASDTLVFRSAKFKMLFGAQAEPVNQAKFRVVKLNNQLSDNEIKLRILRAMSNYFNIANWEFGETFYFTELSTYIHQQLGSAIGSIVIVPRNSSGQFGNLFQIKAEPNELFLSVATVDDIEIVETINTQTLRADR